MSSEAEADNLKGGHAPAVKVGGMRVVQHKKEGEKEAPPMTAEEIEEYGAGPQKPDKKAQQILISGADPKIDKNFTPEAVKSFHEKPMPQLNERPRQPQISRQINQPR